MMVKKYIPCPTCFDEDPDIICMGDSRLLGTIEQLENKILNIERAYVLEEKKQLTAEIRAIVIEELPKCLEMLLAMEEE